jgi:DNA mismatch repair protein MLH1
LKFFSLNWQIMEKIFILFSEELFYQMFIYNFGSFEKIVFENPLSVKDLAMLALDSPDSGWTEEDGDKDELAERIVEILSEKSEMMLQYFSLEIKEGMLLSLPVLLSTKILHVLNQKVKKQSLFHYLGKHLPSVAQLPNYLLRLATEVDWDNESSCFESFARETASFYSQISETTAGSEWKWCVEFVIYPALKKYFLPSQEFSVNKSLFQIASLPDLYKVFERC